MLSFDLFIRSVLFIELFLRLVHFSLCPIALMRAAKQKAKKTICLSSYRSILR